MIHLKLHNREAEELLRALDRRKDELLDGLLMQLVEKLRKVLPPKRDSESYAVNLNGVPVKFTRDRPRPMRPLKGSYNIRERRRRQKERAEKRTASAALPYPEMVGQREKALRKESRREERSEIRDRCVVRSEGRCENLNCRRPATEHYPAHWDHFFGRKRAESVETTWMLCPDCDHLKTHNDPDAATWYRRFIRHLDESCPPTRAYRAARKRAEERLAFVEVRAALPSSPRTRHD